MVAVVFSALLLGGSICHPTGEILAAEQQENAEDDLNYETDTLKVNIEQKDTGYTKYWIAHVQTFSTKQLKSALCGGTYGNPRKNLQLTMGSLALTEVRFPMAQGSRHQARR